MTEEKSNVVKMPPKLKTKETTLGEMGVRLAIGTGGQGPDKLNKTLSFGEMTTADEKAIAKRTKKGVTMGEQVAIVLAQMVRQLGEYNLSEKSFDERLVQINRLYIGDVLTAYLWLRIETMGQYLNLDVKCACSPKVTLSIRADLKTTKVITVDDENDMIWEFSLEKPITCRDKKVEKLTVTTPRWTTIAEINESSGSTLAAMNGLRSAVIGFNGAKDLSFIFNEDEFDQLKKLDLMRFASEIEEHVVGPHMVAVHECPNCGAENTSMLNWRYSDFFAHSSASKTKRR
jgi:hypothetical protein